MTATQQLVSWAFALERVPADVERAAARHLLDGLGCAVAASRRGVADPAITVARRYDHPSESTVLGTSHRIAAPAAALANGTLVHALDFDDTHADGLVHATAAVLPALFAVGERVGASGERLLRAAVIGYETVTRLGSAVPHGFHARGLHATSVCGVFAATLVSAILMELTEEQSVHALGIAGSQAAGLLEFLDTGASTKQLHPGLAGQSGVLAAELAHAGATGPQTVLEGRNGLYAALLGAKPGDLFADLGAVWETTRITVKPYPACQLVHASLDALRTLSVRAEDVAEVRCAVPAASVDIIGEPRAAKVAPRSPYDAKFSLPWCAAVLILDGRVAVDSFAEVSREDAAALAAQVHLDVVEHAGAPASAPARVTVRLRDGRTLVATAPASSAAGDDDVLAKAVANGVEATVAREVLDLGSCTDLTALLHRLEAPA